MYMPPKVLTNFDLEKMVDTTDEWIRERTGVCERRLAVNGECQSDLSALASREALARVGWDPKDLDAIVVGTVTPDHIFPSSANMLAGKLGAIGTPSYDVLAACSGFMYALWQGIMTIESGRADKVLVVGSEIMNRIIDWDDRATCVLFGDGAGAVLLEAVEEPYGVMDIEIGSDGRYYDLLHMEAGGSTYPSSHESVEKDMHYLRMAGAEVYKLAVRKMTEVSKVLMERNNVKPEDISCFITHQANARISEATAKRLKLKPEQLYSNINRYGNTTSATIPTCIYEAEAEGRIKKGDCVLLASFGAGLTWAGILMRWAADPLPKYEENYAAMAMESLPEKLKPIRDWNRT